MKQNECKPVQLEAVVSPESNYHNQYKTMVMVAASINQTLAFQIIPPEDFYELGSLWKLTVAGTATLPSGGGFLRRTLQIGDTVLSVLQGSPRGQFPINFHDEIMFSMYRDTLFDVMSKGITAISPTNILNTETSLQDSQPAQAEWATSGYGSPLVDRALPLDIYLFASPIANPLIVYLNIVNLTRIA